MNSDGDATKYKVLTAKGGEISHILFHIKSFSALIVQNGHYYNSLKNEVICRPLLFQTGKPFNLSFLFILKLLQLYFDKGAL